MYSSKLIWMLRFAPENKSTRYWFILSATYY